MPPPCLSAERPLAPVAIMLIAILISTIVMLVSAGHDQFMERHPAVNHGLCFLIADRLCLVFKSSISKSKNR